MADAGAIRAGKAYVEMGLDSSSLSKDLKKSEQETQGFIARMKAKFGDMANFDAIKNKFNELRDALKNDDPMAAAGAILPFLGPIGRAIALALQFKDSLAPIGGKLLSMSAAGRQAFEYLKTEFTTLWGGMKDAVQGGDLILAFRILGAELKVVWADFLTWLDRTFPAIAGSFRGVSDAIVTEFRNAADFITRVVAIIADVASGKGLPQLRINPITGQAGLVAPRGGMLEDVEREQRRQAQLRVTRPDLQLNPRQELEALLDQARALNRRPAEIQEIARGARGTFNAAVAPNLVGRRPEEQINSQLIRANEQRERGNQQRQQMIDGQQGLRDDVRRIKGFAFQ